MTPESLRHGLPQRRNDGPRLIGEAVDVRPTSLNAGLNFIECFSRSGGVRKASIEINDKRDQYSFRDCLAVNAGLKRIHFKAPVVRDTSTVEGTAGCESPPSRARRHTPSPTTSLRPIGSSQPHEARSHARRRLVGLGLASVCHLQKPRVFASAFAEIHDNHVAADGALGGLFHARNIGPANFTVTETLPQNI